MRMSTLVKVQPKGQMTILRKVRSAVGLADGDLVEARAVGKRIVIIPQPAIDRSKLPDADEGIHSRTARRLLSARPDKAERGSFYGPFKNGAEVAAFLGEKFRSAARSAKSRKLG
jgi:bifunctional DNA-binding transcriptional regulator/antitoxin component of YhaV-PrlF toxin-antitoxin module